ncbi:ABC transporter ATP-binding protein [Lutibaculum baratangense]|uniref:Branched-chain amino acid transport ATP-binding protein LivF n=1 Tax=Lutibaculum baratangense AMV1 TaxID=631454 RepID=V4QTJ4_9HYPH|nr:ABC transporter ATP-binding protein [Lutibaculum baratangense]ESR23077.1 Branched-chain amino acid transport ATP-binding protein LivF [Lutibaculum baratangense AMV1]
MTGAGLRVRDLDSFYGPAQILFEVGFDVAPGEVVALLGRNGAGKSTTLRSLMGLMARREGEISFRDTRIETLPTYEIARLGLGYVPEDRRIFTELTVEENLTVGQQRPREGVTTWTPERLYALFPNLAEMRRRPGGQMSGGEQQMLTIARTLMGNPSLILLDEPSEGLAPKIIEQMADAIVTMKREGLSIVISEQNLHFARLICDRAYILEKGRIRFQGSMAELEADEAVRNQYLAV